MSNATIFKTTVYFLFFVLPIIGISNCSGWNVGNMEVHTCFVNGILFKQYAEFYTGMVMMSGLLLGLPIGLYVYAIYSRTKKYAKEIEENKRSLYKTLILVIAFFLLFFVVAPNAGYFLT